MTQAEHAGTGVLGQELGTLKQMVMSLSARVEVVDGLGGGGGAGTAE